MPSALFPDPPRELPGQRGIKIALRAVHVLCAGVLTATYLLDLGAEPEPIAAAREAWFSATIASGGAILALDLYQSAAFLLQVRGAVLLAKLACVASLGALGDAAGYALAGVVLVSVVSSHAPSRWRYKVLVPGVRGSRSAG